MNKLDTLKKQWKNQKFAKNFSKEELFHLTQKKSISSIKWIFIFSCIEFFAYLLFPFVIPDYFDAFEYYKSIHLFEFSIVNKRFIPTSKVEVSHNAVGVRKLPL